MSKPPGKEIKGFGMDTQAAVDLFRTAIWVGFLISAPVLLAGMVVGLVLGLLQAVTQIQEQSLVFVPKVAVMVIVFLLTLPWMLVQMIEYSQELLKSMSGIIY